MLRPDRSPEAVNGCNRVVNRRAETETTFERVLSVNRISDVSERVGHGTLPPEWVGSVVRWWADVAINCNLAVHVGCGQWNSAVAVPRFVGRQVSACDLRWEGGIARAVCVCNSRSGRGGSNYMYGAVGVIAVAGCEPLIRTCARPHTRRQLIAFGVVAITGICESVCSVSARCTARLVVDVVSNGDTLRTVPCAIRS